MINPFHDGVDKRIFQKNLNTTARKDQFLNSYSIRNILTNTFPKPTRIKSRRTISPVKVKKLCIRNVLNMSGRVEWDGVSMQLCFRLREGKIKYEI